MFRLSSAFVLCALAGLGSAIEVIGPSGDMHVVNAQLAPDGTSRSTVVVNGQFPGPVIRGVKGDRFSLNVIDELHDNTMRQSTSIHWHGLFQHGTNYADGPSFVTQCPIARNHSFLYDFEVPDQAGSFWYHSHLSVQYCDGLRGAFVVYDGEDGVNDPHRALYDVDDETTIITLADWYQLPSPQLLLVAGAKVGNTTLINGKGRFGGNPTAELAVINVSPGKRYRFRIISISCSPNYIFSIDGHNLTLIETDGENITPITVNAIDVFAGQRYSAVLEATQPVGNYWVRAEPNINQFTDFENGINSAILRYDGAEIAEPTTSAPPDLTPVSEAALHALEAPGAPGQPFPGGADVVLNMEVGFDPVTQLFSINNNSFFPPTVPVLLQILSGTHKAQELLPTGSVFGLPLNRSVEINLFGGSAPGSPHPFHLHGHTFDVVKTWDSDTFNFVNPVRRDVTPVFAGNLTTLRFNTDNPGPWFLHCHIDFHLDAGLAVVMAEDVPDVKATENVPESWKELCPIYDRLPDDQL